MPAWKCGARTGQLTATRATRATRLIPTALGSPPVRRTARARPRSRACRFLAPRCTNVARDHVCAVQAVPPAGFEPAAFCSGGRSGPFAGVHSRPRDANAWTRNMPPHLWFQATEVHCAALTAQPPGRAAHRGCQTRSPRGSDGAARRRRRRMRLAGVRAATRVS